MKRSLGVVLIACLLVAMTPINAMAKDEPLPRVLIPRATPVKPSHTTVSANERSGYVHLKFREGSTVRLRGQRFASLDDADVSAVSAVLQAYPNMRHGTGT